MAINQDVFGTQMLGSDPYAQQAADRISRLGALDTIVRNTGTTKSSKSGTTVNGRVVQAAAAGGGDGGSCFGTPPKCPTGARATCREGEWRCTTATPGKPDPGDFPPDIPSNCDTLKCPSGQQVFHNISRNRCECGPPGSDRLPPGGGRGRDPGGVGNPGGVGSTVGSSQGGNASASINFMPGTIPQDIMGLRAALASLLTGKINTPLPKYGGNLNIKTPGTFNDAVDAAQQGADAGSQFFDPAGSELRSQFGFNPLSDVSGFQNAAAEYVGGRTTAQQGLPWLEAARGDLTQLQNTGAGPDITAALNAIRQQSNLGLEDQLAQIREQFGGMGLAASTDVNEALGRGASRGIADMNAQQQQLITQVMNAAADRRLGATALAPQFAAEARAPWENAYNRGVQAMPAALQGRLANAEEMRSNLALQQGAAGQLGQLGQMAGSSHAQAAQVLAQLTALDASLQEGNINRNYQEFIRTTGPSPWLDTAASFATGFPPPAQQKPVVQGNDNSGMWSMFGALGAAALPLIFSSPSLKENIEPLSVPRNSIVKKVGRVPVYRWNYKGDARPHIGPMADDWAKEFPGDGKTIHVVDALGAILASIHELDARLENLNA